MMNEPLFARLGRQNQEFEKNEYSRFLIIEKTTEHNYRGEGPSHYYVKGFGTREETFAEYMRGSKRGGVRKIMERVNPRKVFSRELNEYENDDLYTDRFSIIEDRGENPRYGDRHKVTEGIDSEERLMKLFLKGPGEYGAGFEIAIELDVQELASHMYPESEEIEEPTLAFQGPVVRKKHLEWYTPESGVVSYEVEDEESNNEPVTDEVERNILIKNNIKIEDSVISRSRVGTLKFEGAEAVKELEKEETVNYIVGNSGRDYDCEVSGSRKLLEKLLSVEKTKLPNFDDYEERAREVLYKSLELAFRREKNRVRNIMAHFELEKIDFNLDCADVSMDLDGNVNYRNFTFERDGKQYCASEKNMPSGTYNSLRDFGKIMQYEEEMMDALGGGYGCVHLSDKERIRRSFGFMRKRGNKIIEKYLMVK